MQCDLVQVLQNRLDDAVLDFLSVMLARNAMCPLTPDDVHFIQKPFRLPEVVIRVNPEYFFQFRDILIVNCSCRCKILFWNGSIRLYII